MIIVRVRLYGHIRSQGIDQLEIKLSKEKRDVKSLIKKVFKDTSQNIDSWFLTEDRKLRSKVLPLKDGKVLSLHTILEDGDEIKLLPPYVGG